MILFVITLFMPNLTFDLFLVDQCCKCCRELHCSLLHVPKTCQNPSKISQTTLSTSFHCWGLWKTGAAGSHHWQLLGGLFRFLSDSEGPPLSLESPFTSNLQRAREQGLSTHTHTHTGTHTIIPDKLWTLGGMLWPPCGLLGEHLTYCCSLILTSTLPVTPRCQSLIMPPLHHHIFFHETVKLC